MDRNWTIELVQDVTYAVLNHTAYVATDVEMSAHGPMTRGPFGQTNWRQTYDEILPGRGIQEIFGRAWGAETPYLRIEWTGPDGIRRAEDVEVPFPA